MKNILNNILKILLSKTVWGAALIAFFLWIYISLNEESTIGLTIPIDVVLPIDYALESEVNKYINITVNGKGWDIFISKYFDKTENNTCRIDMTNDIIDDTVIVISRDRIFNEVSVDKSLVPIGISIDDITLVVGKILEKEVPLRPDVKIDTRVGYKQFGDIEVIPSTIIVRGNKNALKEIHEWKTKPIVFSDISRNLVENVSIDNSSDIIKPTSEYAIIKATIKKSADIIIKDIPIKIRGSITGNHKIYPEHIDLAIAGSLEDISNFSADSVNVFLYASDIIKDKQGLLVPKIIISDRYTILSTKPNYLEHYYEHNVVTIE